MKVVTHIEYQLYAPAIIYKAMSKESIEKVTVFYEKLKAEYPYYKDKHGVTRVPVEIDIELKNFIFSEIVRYVPANNTYHVL